jgi:transcriptional regulator GlxA family with amidase domain
MPPAEFVLQKRLQRAVKLLTKATHLPVKEVAIMSGFEDANYFSKVFRRCLRHQSHRIPHDRHVFQHRAFFA